VTREEAINEAAKILAEHFPYRLGVQGKDANGDCKALLAIAEALMKAANSDVP
jgi:hypothetical protein